MVIFKKILFLPREIDYQLSLIKEVSWLTQKIQQKHLISMMFNLGPKTFLLVLSAAKLPHWTNSVQVDSVAAMIQLLREQNEKYTGDKNKKVIQPEIGLIKDTTQFETKRSK